MNPTGLDVRLTCSPATKPNPRKNCDPAVFGARLLPKPRSSPVRYTDAVFCTPLLCPTAWISWRPCPPVLISVVFRLPLASAWAVTVAKGLFEYREESVILTYSCGANPLALRLNSWLIAGAETWSGVALIPLPLTTRVLVAVYVLVWPVAVTVYSPAVALPTLKFCWAEPLDWAVTENGVNAPTGDAPMLTDSPGLKPAM